MEESKNKRKIYPEANRKYYEKAIRQFKLDLNRNTDADIIEHLENLPNKTGYIKELIRADLNKNK